MKEPYMYMGPIVEVDTRVALDRIQDIVFAFDLLHSQDVMIRMVASRATDGWLAHIVYARRTDYDAWMSQYE